MATLTKKKAAGKPKKRMGLQAKLLTSILVPIVVLLFLLLVVMISIITSIVSTINNDRIEQQVNAVSKQVQEYFDKFFLVENLVMNEDACRQLILESEQSADNQIVDSPYYEEATATLAAAKSICGEDVLDVWVATVNSNQLLQAIGEVTDPSTYVITERGWYKQLLESNGEPILTEVYPDALTNDTVVTAVTPYFDSSNKLIGAFGIDIYLTQLSDYLSTLTIGETGCITAFDCTDSIAYHKEPELVMKKLNEVDYSQNIVDALSSHQSSHLMKFNRGSLALHGCSAYLDEYGWTLLGTIPDKEYYQEVFLIFIFACIGSVLCALIVCVICIRRSKQIVLPVQRLNAAAAEFAKGNLSVDIEATTNDEIGDLTRVFIQTKNSLRQIINDIRNVLQMLSDKNLTATTSAQYAGDFTEIEEALKRISSSMNSVMFIIKGATNQVDAEAQQMASGAQQLAQGATEQNSAIETFVSTMNNLSSEMKEMSDHADQASIKAAAVGDDVELSNKQMQLMMQAMERIDNESNKIQNIIKTIEDIAFQTDILALNAAVEAARAGAAGRGFAVVADEVRNLAGKSAEASKTTNELISNSMEAVKDGITLARKATESLAQAVGDVQSVSTNISDVSNDLQKHSNTVHELLSNMEQISRVVQNNSATAEESAATSEELFSQANMLKEIVSSFQLINPPKDR